MNIRITTNQCTNEILMLVHVHCSQHMFLVECLLVPSPCCPYYDMLAFLKIGVRRYQQEERRGGEGG